jgi:predicted metal-dependent phosphoesterase TrpH
VIDLHLHSTCSDGTLTPAELVEMAGANGLNAIALTDHDTVAGIAPARAAARNSPLVVIAGVELSVRHSPYYLHLLGYDFDWHNPTLLAALKKVQDARHTRNLEIFKKLQGLGIDYLISRNIFTFTGESYRSSPYCTLVGGKKNRFNNR